MPAYEYECVACSHRFEKRQKMSDEPVSICPKCGSDGVKRLISGGAGAISKGSGGTAFDAPPACGMGGCCAQGGACCGGGGCDD